VAGKSKMKKKKKKKLHSRALSDESDQSSSSSGSSPAAPARRGIVALGLSEASDESDSSSERESSRERRRRKKRERYAEKLPRLSSRVLALLGPTTVQERLTESVLAKVRAEAPPGTSLHAIIKARAFVQTRNRMEAERLAQVLDCMLAGEHTAALEILVRRLAGVTMGDTGNWTFDSALAGITERKSDLPDGVLLKVMKRVEQSTALARSVTASGVAGGNDRVERSRPRPGSQHAAAGSSYGNRPDGTAASSAAGGSARRDVSREHRPAASGGTSSHKKSTGPPPSQGPARR
jgi:hypothetical protein